MVRCSGLAFLGGGGSLCWGWVVGSCGTHSFLQSKHAQFVGGAGLTLSLAELEAGAGTASGLLKRMNGIPDTDGELDAARPAAGLNSER